MLNLCNLKYLKLEDCVKLKSVFSYSTTQTMMSLEVLEVIYCPLLEHLITYEGSDDIVSIRTVFLKLKQVYVKSCDRMMYIMPASLAGHLLLVASHNLRFSRLN